ncbi:AMP-binding protein [Streptomyces sp. ME19-03-3]|nr:AMP-binding protein [Streptomyces sp. ME19-03-3]
MRATPAVDPAASGGSTAADDTASAGGAVNAPPDVYAAVEEQAQRAPDAPAVVDATGTSSYSGLLTAAASLARALPANGVRPGDLVGLYGLATRVRMIA